MLVLVTFYKLSVWSDSSLWTGHWYSWYTINVKVASFFLPSTFSTPLHCGSYVDCTIIQDMFQLWESPIVSFNRHTKTFQSFDFHADVENSRKRLFFSFDSLTKPDQPRKTDTGRRRRGHRCGTNCEFDRSVACEQPDSRFCRGLPSTADDFWIGTTIMWNMGTTNTGIANTEIQKCLTD